MLLAAFEAPLGALGGDWSPILAILAAPEAHFWRSWRHGGQQEAPGEPQEKPEAQQEGPKRG